MKSDVLGIYGQNGSGKTTFIHVLGILKCLLSGAPITECLEDHISKGSEHAELEFGFCVEDDKGGRSRVVYSARMGLGYLDESVKASVLKDDEWTRMNPVFMSRQTDLKIVVTPDTRRKEVFGKDPQIADELRVTKLLCAKEHRSFLFSEEFLGLMQRGSGDTLWQRMFAAMRQFGKVGLFVIDNRSTGLIALDAGLPFNFRTDTAMGQFALPLDTSILLPIEAYEVVRQVIETINIVLREIIPHMEIALLELGKEAMEKGGLGIRVQLVRTAFLSATGETIQLPLKYESEGIKKIISILHLFICAYDRPDITLAVDELDSGIYEYLLGELLHIMQKSGLGQLIFTSHNLRPLEMLDSTSIIFTTTNPENRYVRASNIKPSNNLRLRYFRDITLGSDGEGLCQEINSIEIAHAMRKVGISGRDVTEGT